jgi:hypothetical protein
MRIPNTSDRKKNSRASIVAAREEKRGHPRLSTDLDVRLYWQDDIGNLFDAPASVKTVSVEGFGIEVDTGLEIGRLVTVKTPKGNSLYCVVRHRQSGQKGVLVGLEALSTRDANERLRVLERLSAALKRAADEA